MRKISKSKNKAGAAVKVDPYLEGMMSKLVDRLIGLERKIDALISRTENKSSGNGNLPKPIQASQVKQASHRDRTLYEAICADCHKVCEVPFKPLEGRPVYCKECFAKRKTGGAGAPVLTPVALRPKPASKLSQPVTISPASPTAKKTKKPQLAKKPLRECSVVWHELKKKDLYAL